MRVTDSEASAEAVQNRLEEARTRYVRCQFIDYVGQARGREVSVEYFIRHLRRGVATAPVNYTWDVEDLDYDRRFGPEAGDVFLVPDASSLVVLPYLEGNAQVFCDVIGADGNPWPGCTRQALKRVVALTERELGQASFGFEQEGFLVRKGPAGYEPGTRFKPHTSDFFDVHQAFMGDLLDVLARLGTPVEKFNLEDGNGQIELNVRPASPLVAAEQNFRLKQAFRYVAGKHGFVGTFMPKPFDGIAGSGLHLHLSIRDSAGTEVFGDAGQAAGDNLSVSARHFVGGLLRHAGALLAAGCPTVNSYKRLRPGMFAPTHAAYGVGNRAAMVRVVRTRWGAGPDPAQHIEVRAADGTCNPYLVAAALLAAGLDGVRNSIDPGTAVAEDVGSMSDASLMAAGVRPLPRNLAEALDAFEADRVVCKALGPEVVAGFLRVKRLEWSNYCAHVSDWEHNRYLEAF